MKIEISSLGNVPKEARFFSEDKLVQCIKLSNKKQSVDNLELPLRISVGYSQSIFKKIAGFLGYLIMMVASVHGNEIVEAVYIDVIEIESGENDITLIHTEKSPFFLVSETDAKYSIERKVDKKDYVLLVLFFFLPMLIALLLILIVFITSSAGMLLIFAGGLVVISLIVFLLYQMFSLYKKTK